MLFACKVKSLPMEFIFEIRFLAVFSPFRFPSDRRTPRATFEAATRRAHARAHVREHANTRAGALSLRGFLFRPLWEEKKSFIFDLVLAIGDWGSALFCFGSIRFWFCLGLVLGLRE